jgi:hypothetical protein
METEPLRRAGLRHAAIEARHLRLGLEFQRLPVNRDHHVRELAAMAPES